MLTLQNNVIRNNRGNRGAGIAATGNGVKGGIALMEGNVVEDNIGYGDHGGGVYVSVEDLTFRNNLVQRNSTTGWGGGIICHSGAVMKMSNNVVTRNVASTGGGIFSDEGADIFMDHDLVYKNYSYRGVGAAIYVDGGNASSITIKSSTIAHNNLVGAVENGRVVEKPPVANGRSNSLFMQIDTVATVENSIFWGNGPDEFYVEPNCTLNISHSIAQTTRTGGGAFNVSNVTTVDPMFADVANDNYRLKSAAGRWNDATNTWANDTVTSPAIDKGNPTAAFANEAAPNGGRMNLGFDGNTARTSKSGS